MMIKLSSWYDSFRIYAKFTALVTTLENYIVNIYRGERGLFMAWKKMSNWGKHKMHMAPFQKKNTVIISREKDRKAK